MSLFDVIRYPVTDIFNDEEMNKIPIEIFEPAVREFCILAGYEFSTYEANLGRRNRGQTLNAIIWHAPWWYRAQALLGSVVLSDPDRQQLRAELTEKFANILRERIKDYE